MEIAVRNILHDRPVDNVDALANPRSPGIFPDHQDQNSGEINEAVPGSLGILFVVIALVLGGTGTALAEEGMYPMSELGTLDLEAAGLAVDQAAIYNPDGLALVDGICKLGGCTGSFVSDQGLILTNHHCAYGAVRNASTDENDILTDGFSPREPGRRISRRGLHRAHHRELPGRFGRSAGRGDRGA